MAAACQSCQPDCRSPWLWKQTLFCTNFWTSAVALWNSWSERERVPSRSLEDSEPRYRLRRIIVSRTRIASDNPIFHHHARLHEVDSWVPEERPVRHPNDTPGHRAVFQPLFQSRSHIRKSYQQRLRLLGVADGLRRCCGSITKAVSNVSLGKGALTIR